MDESIEKSYFGNVVNGDVRMPCDLVLGVNVNCDRFLRFDLLSKNVDGENTYSSKAYCLDIENGFNGFFDFFDDFFQKRIRFFNSSESVQRFLLALNYAESKFMERTGKSFFEYYHCIHNHTVDTINLNNSFMNPMSEFLSSGYGIESESKKSYEAKSSFILLTDHIKYITSDFLIGFNSDYYKQNRGNFICIDTTGGENVFFIDSVVDMPMLFHYFDFAKTYIDNLLIPYVKSGIFENDENPKIEIYTLSNNIKLNELLSIYGKEGYVLTDGGYKSEFLSGDVKTISFDDDYIEGKMISSIIAH